MTRRSAFINHPLLRAKWVIPFLVVFAWGYAPAVGQGGLAEGHSACHGATSPESTVLFAPITHEISTTTLVGSEIAELRWTLSSEVTVATASARRDVRYCYAYLFKNAGAEPVKVSLVSPRLAMSPLFEIMQDFSLVLPPGATEAIRFSSDSAPTLSPATVYNSARDENISKWQFVSSGPISLYLPAMVQASYRVSE